MESPVLHIKDAYYFEVPKFLWRSDRDSVDDFPEVYIRLDPDYQRWEAGRIYERLADSDLVSDAQLPPQEELLEDWEHWQHEPGNFAKPLDVYLETAAETAWFRQRIESPRAAREWAEIKERADSIELYKEAIAAGERPGWSPEKIEEYNSYLDGKILIPQPFGTLRNLYERESGFAISKFMIIELLVAAILCLLFIRLANRMRREDRPRGRLWNMFEAILLYFRDYVVRPAIGGKEADKFVPLLWTMFLFILGLNLMGMIPWMGAPSGSFGVTLGMAFITLGAVVAFGMKKFGFIGFFKNLVPHLGLPLLLGIPIVAMIFLIEFVGLLIKHGVLGVRLLANMVAGHLVLLAIMGLGTAAAASAWWPVVAVIAVVGSALISCLELFVAFLQAFIFTFLSALFIGMAIHHH